MATLVDLGLLTNHGTYPFGRESALNKDEIKRQHRTKPWYEPDLFCGRKPSSEATDMYSFGYLMKNVLRLLPKSTHRLRLLVHRALGSAERRPSFLEARFLIREVAASIHAWRSGVSSLTF